MIKRYLVIAMVVIIAIITVGCNVENSDNLAKNSNMPDARIERIVEIVKEAQNIQESQIYNVETTGSEYMTEFLNKLGVNIDNVEESVLAVDTSENGVYAVGVIKGKSSRDANQIERSIIRYNNKNKNNPDISERNKEIAEQGKTIAVDDCYIVISICENSDIVMNSIKRGMENIDNTEEFIKEAYKDKYERVNIY